MSGLSPLPRVCRHPHMSDCDWNPVHMEHELCVLIQDAWFTCRAIMKSVYHKSCERMRLYEVDIFFLLASSSWWIAFLFAGLNEQPSEFELPVTYIPFSPVQRLILFPWQQLFSRNYIDAWLICSTGYENKKTLNAVRYSSTLMCRLQGQLTSFLETLFLFEYYLSCKMTKTPHNAHTMCLNCFIIHIQFCDIMLDMQTHCRYRCSLYKLWSFLFCASLLLFPSRCPCKIKLKLLFAALWFIGLQAPACAPGLALTKCSTCFNQSCNLAEWT